MFEDVTSVSFKVMSNSENRLCNSKLVGPTWSSSVNSSLFPLGICALTYNGIFDNTNYSCPTPVTLNSIGVPCEIVAIGLYSTNVPDSLLVYVGGTIKR